MKKIKILVIVGLAVVFASGVFYLYSSQSNSPQINIGLTDESEDEMDESGLTSELDPLTIEALRQGEYPGSDVVVEQVLDPGTNYNRYIVSYKSEGLKIFALLTIPQGEKPEDGWPAIVFNHGYIPPLQYRTAERYAAYTDGFSRAGYVLFKPDYRGHGNSEGEPGGAYGSNGYLIDVLNAISSIKKHKDVDPNRIGMWGHSLGGFLTLRSMVITKDVKVGIIWAGVVGSYPDMLNNWRRRRWVPPPGIPTRHLSWRQRLVDQYGSPEQNPDFWASISANSFVADLSGSIQLHHGTADSSVPVSFSQALDQQIKKADRTSELYTYQGDDHNLSASFNTAMRRSVEFFDRYLKGGE